MAESAVFNIYFGAFFARLARFCHWAIEILKGDLSAVDQYGRGYIRYARPGEGGCVRSQAMHGQVESSESKVEPNSKPEIFRCHA